MKDRETLPYWKLLASVLLVSVIGPYARGGDLTAFELIKEANRYVGEQSKDKVVQIRSEKSIGSLTPVVRFVVLYDPTATLKATEVQFAVGKMVAVKRPFPLFQPPPAGA